MANKKLIKDLKTIECSCGDLWIQNVAGRALEEIEYLENVIREKQAALDWKDFKPGDIK